MRIRTFMTEGFIGFTTTLKNTEIISLEFDTQTFNLKARMQSCSIRLQDSLITNIFESNQYQYLAEKFSKENKPLRPFLSVGCDQACPTKFRPDKTYKRSFWIISGVHSDHI